MTRIRGTHSSPLYNQFQRYTTKEHRNSILKLRCKSKRGNHFVRNGRARPRGVFCCERQPPTAFPSGQTRFSPDETTLRCFPSGKSHNLPDVKPLRLARQNHFGSDCAPEACRMVPLCQSGAKIVSLRRIERPGSKQKKGWPGNSAASLF